jgi:hypothetical protein
MAATQQDIRRWLADGKAKGATHVIVACDTFGWSDYPIFVMPEQDAKAKSLNLGDMRKLQEVYNLSLDFEVQLRAPRSFNY